MNDAQKILKELRELRQRFDEIEKIFRGWLIDDEGRPIVPHVDTDTMSPSR